MVAAAVAVTIGTSIGVIFFKPSNPSTPLASSVESIDPNSLLFSPDSKPYGLDFNEWTGKWWTWFVSIPAEQSPAADVTGEKCGMNQNNPNVFFLAGTFTGEAKRNCDDMPRDKAILASFIGIECNEKQDGAISTLTGCAREGLNNLKFAELKIDGVNVPNLTQYRATSAPTIMEFPPAAVWGAPEGRYTLVGDSLLIFMKALPTGHHTMSFRAQIDHPSLDVYDTTV